MNSTLFFISLGTNLGNRINNLNQSIRSIERLIGKVVTQSSVYETAPWGNQNQPDYLNQVIIVRSDLKPEDCLQTLLQIENDLGRTRKQKWEARIIDIDLLYADDQIIKTKELTIPHPFIEQRKFVLTPLAEIAPDFIHPIFKKSQEQLLQECQDTQSVFKI